MRYQWKNLCCSITKGSDGWDARLRSFRKGNGEVIEKSWNEGDCCQYEWESNDSRWRKSFRLPPSNDIKSKRGLRLSYLEIE
jgi:hypothetical protein